MIKMFQENVVSLIKFDQTLRKRKKKKKRCIHAQSLSLNKEFLKLKLSVFKKSCRIWLYFSYFTSNREESS